MIARSDISSIFGAVVDVSEIGKTNGTKVVGSKFKATVGAEVVGRNLEQKLE